MVFLMREKQNKGGDMAEPLLSDVLLAIVLHMHILMSERVIFSTLCVSLFLHFSVVLSLCFSSLWLGSFVLGDDKHTSAHNDHLWLLYIRLDWENRNKSQHSFFYFFSSISVCVFECILVLVLSQHIFYLIIMCFIYSIIELGNAVTDPGTWRATRRRAYGTPMTFCVAFWRYAYSLSWSCHAYLCASTHQHTYAHIKTYYEHTIRSILTHMHTHAHTKTHHIHTRHATMHKTNNTTEEQADRLQCIHEHSAQPSSKINGYFYWYACCVALSLSCVSAFAAWMCFSLWFFLFTFSYSYFASFFGLVLFPFVNFILSRKLNEVRKGKIQIGSVKRQWGVKRSKGKRTFGLLVRAREKRSTLESCYTLLLLSAGRNIFHHCFKKTLRLINLHAHVQREQTYSSSLHTHTRSCTIFSLGCSSSVFIAQGCIQLGKAPTIDPTLTIDMSPVDYVSGAIAVRIFSSSFIPVRVLQWDKSYCERCVRKYTHSHITHAHGPFSHFCL